MRKFNLILLMSLLSGCVTQGSYQEQNTIYFPNSQNSITEIHTSHYQEFGAPTISGALAVQGEQVAAALYAQPQTIHYRSTPRNQYRIYTDGNTTITRATIHPSCTQQYYRHGRLYTRNIPCP